MILQTFEQQQVLQKRHNSHRLS